MRKTAWFLVLGIIGFLYIASSIPGLRVLPVLRQLTHIATGFDYIFQSLSEWIAKRIPLDFGELAYIDAVMRDFLTYIRENPVLIEFFLRKLAHVIIFFFLTIAIFILLYQYISKASIAMILSFFLGFVLAVLDEFRQSFVPGRVASAVDVFIDMIGVSLGILFILFALIITSGERYRFLKHKKMKKKSLYPKVNKHPELTGKFKKQK
ncbi:VanZ family protein [Tindallia californiensis]|uniref:VanZ like family protein n=1 Tax=Tindallia californiensis TaxID=159292 RepID=A0A1H3KLW5_9FIRM|nr:VanZ family protein [Tindallia californiensis]SDY52725.1 VanZ like family protein [Tindallia californiensis]